MISTVNLPSVLSRRNTCEVGTEVPGRHLHRHRRLGGSRGIGAACCSQLAAAGYAVAVNYARNASAAEEVVAAITAGGGVAQAFQADVSSEAEVVGLFAAVVAALGPLKVLVRLTIITTCWHPLLSTVLLRYPPTWKVVSADF